MNSLPDHAFLDRFRLTRIDPKPVVGTLKYALEHQLDEISASPSPELIATSSEIASMEKFNEKMDDAITRLLKFHRNQSGDVKMTDEKKKKSVVAINWTKRDTSDSDDSSNYSMKRKQVIDENLENPKRIKHQGTTVTSLRRASRQSLDSYSEPETLSSGVNDFNFRAHEDLSPEMDSDSDTCPDHLLPKRKPFETLFVKCTYDSCFEFFLTKDDLKDHLVVDHDQLPVHCPLSWCSGSFLSKTLLYIHARQYHYQADWSCLRCNQPFDSVQKLYQHRHRHHHEGNFRCNYGDGNCSVMYKYRYQVMRHNARHY